MSSLEKPTFTQEAVLAAFADHDFLGHIGEQEVHVLTSEVIVDGEDSRIVVEIVFPDLRQ